MYDKRQAALTQHLAAASRCAEANEEWASTRQVLDSETPAVFGISTWLDYRDSDAVERGYYQVSLGLEYLTDWFEIRSNVYVPDIEDGRRELPNRFAGNSLLIERAEIALAGVDVEVGTVLPAVGGQQSSVFE